MGHVIVEVNGRPYTMQCPDGEEDHLRELARLLDAEVTRIRQSVGTVGDIRLLVMSGLMVADRLSEAIRRIETLEEDLRILQENQVAMEADAASLATQVSSRLAAASQRLEAAARDLSS
jgi:cell division protein ZapA